MLSSVHRTKTRSRSHHTTGPAAPHPILTNTSSRTLPSLSSKHSHNIPKLTRPISQNTTYNSTTQLPSIHQQVIISITMHLPTSTLFLALLSTTPTLSLPIPSLQPPPNESTCKAHDHGLVISYTVRINLPYDSQKCDTIHGWMQKYGGTPSLMRCKETDDGGFMFKFNNLRGQAELINNALGWNWPVVAENGGFNCPDH